MNLITLMVFMRYGPSVLDFAWEVNLAADGDSGTKRNKKEAGALIPDFRRMSPEEFARLPRVIQYSVITSKSRARSRDELEADVMRFLRWRWEQESRGCSLTELNRRFGAQAVSLGFSARQLVEGLHYKEQVELVQYKRSFFAILWCWKREITQLYREQLEEMGDSPAARRECEEQKIKFVTQVMDDAIKR